MSLIRNLLSHILLPKQLIITFNGKTYQILRDSAGFKDFYDATKEKNLGKLENLLKQHGYIKVAITEVAKEFDRLQREEVVDKLLPTVDSGDEDDVSDNDINDDVIDEGEDESDDSFKDEQPDPQDAPPAKKKKRAAAIKTEKFDTLSISDNGYLVINGVEFDNKISKKIADLYFDGYDIKGYYRLLKKIAANPEKVIKSGLLDFIAQNDLPITTDGNFLAYKVTRADGFDHHSGLVKYEVGKFVTMERDDVDSSRGVCSGAGLYFASIGYYSHHFGNDGRSARFLVEVDPADVVSIPTSYESSKGRCCRMKVVRRIDWDNSLIPKDSAIIDISEWKNVKPSEEGRKRVQAQVGIEVTGTQKLLKIPDDVLENLKAYVTRRHKEKVNPTLKNAQKAIKLPGTSVGVISEAAQKLGYSVVEGDIFSSSTINPKATKKKK